MSTAIELRDVFRVHSTPEGDAAALQGLSLQVADGEVLTVLGPSGSGQVDAAAAARRASSARPRASCASTARTSASCRRVASRATARRCSATRTSTTRARSRPS